MAWVISPAMKKDGIGQWSTKSNVRKECDPYNKCHAGSTKSSQAYKLDNFESIDNKTNYCRTTIEAAQKPSKPKSTERYLTAHNHLNDYYFTSSLSPSNTGSYKPLKLSNNYS